MPNDRSPVRTASVGWQQAVRVCPPEIQQRIESLPLSILEKLEEMRFRVGQPLQLCGNSLDVFLQREGGVTVSPSEAYLVTDEVLKRVIQAVTQSSLYAVEDELRRGFVTMPGGHRVGVGGRVVLYENGHVRTIRSFNGINVRIAKEQLGAADRLRPYFRAADRTYPFNTLILSPPQCGKTTLLRDLSRQLSEGTLFSPERAFKVSVVDERSEIAGCVDGVPQFQLGPRTDVLDACPKAEGMLMMIRSLSPDVVVTDEIGRKEDRDAIVEATHAGVSVIATAHSANLEEWRRRPYMGELFESGAFERYVLLSRRRGPGTLEQVLDKRGNLVHGSSRS